MNNFIGKDGFIWWVGIIESRADPLGLGRCRVRIFGWHTDNTMNLPTEDLPWALPVYPLNNSKTFSAPMLGEWVVGFFMDGESAQAPIMLGVLPGIVQPAYATAEEVTDTGEA
jgi:phage baseplate assembly protein gpV